MERAENGKTRSAPSWLRLAGFGCGAVALVLAAVMAGIVTLTYQHYGRDIAIQTEVEQRLGSRDAYRVPPDGTLSADRVGRFLAIRRALAPRCGNVTEITGSFRSVLEDARGGQPDVGSLVSRVVAAARRVPSMGLVFGEYVTERNSALLAHEMGFGEYSWIYVTAYFALLGQHPLRVLEGEGRPSLFEDRVFPESAKVIARHVAAAGLETGPWVEELARLRQDPSRVPFQDGLPRKLEASLLPFREGLAQAACPAAAELDLTITVRRPTFGYDHR
jgi:hypothetical protein